MGLIFLRVHGSNRKSTAINAVRATLPSHEKLVMATTRKASVIIGGSTLFSKNLGLALPLGNNFRLL